MSEAQLDTTDQILVTEPTLDGQPIKRKMRFSGRVVKLTLAGAIVDIGLEKPAVLHISRMSKDHVNRAEQVLKVGDEIDVWIQRIDPTTGLVELTLIRPLDLEWRDIKKGLQVKGQVVRLEKFGAFVEIGAERPGLVHVSEITRGYIREPSEVLKAGEEVEAVVVGVDRRKKRIQLSMKALEPELEKPARSERPPRAKASEVEEPEEVEEPVPTAMEFAIRQALEQNKGEAALTDEDTQAKNRPSKNQEELEAILARTLEQELQSS